MVFKSFLLVFPWNLVLFISLRDFIFTSIKVITKRLLHNSILMGTKSFIDAIVSLQSQTVIWVIIPFLQMRKLICRESKALSHIKKLLNNFSCDREECVINIIIDYFCIIYDL